MGGSRWTPTRQASPFSRQTSPYARLSPRHTTLGSQGSQSPRGPSSPQRLGKSYESKCWSCFSDFLSITQGITRMSKQYLDVFGIVSYSTERDWAGFLCSILMEWQSVACFGFPMSRSKEKLEPGPQWDEIWPKPNTYKQGLRIFSQPFCWMGVGHRRSPWLKDV